MKKQNSNQPIADKAFIMVDLKVLIRTNIPFFVLLATLALILYGNTIWGKFLSADDIPGIVNNPLVLDFYGSLRTLDLERIYPATLIKVFGMNPIPFHIFSILVHTVNAILVFLFVYLVFEKRIAIITSLLFMAHPLNIEAVSWISAYGYLVYTFTNLAILILFVLYRKTADKKFFIASVVVFCAGLIFYRKPWMILSPAFVLLIDQLILQPKINIKKSLVTLWFIVPSAIYIFTWLKDLLLSRQSALVNLYYADTIDPTPYLNRILYTTYMTLKLYLFPQALTIYHEGEQVASLGFFTLLTAIISPALIITTIILFKKSAKQEYDSDDSFARVRSPNKIAATSILIIYTSIAFSYSPQVLVWSMAERYLYFGSIFFCLVVAIFVNKYADKYKNVMYLLALVLVLYGIKTVWRNVTWQNNKNLWTSTQKVSLYSYRVYNNLGDVASAEGDIDTAIKYFQTSIQLNPGFADAVHNLGYAYYQKGDIGLAKQYFEKSLEMNPNLYPAAYKLGVIAYNERDYSKAQEYFVKVLQINPTDEQAKKALILLDQLNK